MAYLKIIIEKNSCTDFRYDYVRMMFILSLVCSSHDEIYFIGSETNWRLAGWLIDWLDRCARMFAKIVDMHTSTSTYVRTFIHSILFVEEPESFKFL